jgi:hypothetical protein
MGEGWEWVAAGQGNDGCGSCQTYHVGIHPQEDRGGTTGAVGEGETEEGDVKSGTRTSPLRWQAFRFDQQSQRTSMPDELGNTCDRARQHCRTVCLWPQTRSTAPHEHTEILPPSSYTNRRDVSQVTRLCRVFATGKPGVFPLLSWSTGCIARDCLFFSWVSNCEQRTGCSGVTLPLTWRVGVSWSISERVDIFPAVHPLTKSSPMQGVGCVSPAD